MDNLNLFCQIQKVDEAQRLVYGRATEETPDGVREILDYNSSKPHFEKWSTAAEKRSGGKSRGNIREMHQPVAAGKVIDLAYNDAEKAIDIGTYCSDDNTWQKILDGTLTGFSVGGKYVKRWPDPNNPSFIRYTAEPQEISYVDAPAVPTATFKLIKADGSEEMRKFKNPVELNVPADNDEIGNEVVPAPVGDEDPRALEQVPSGEIVKEIPVAGGVPSPNVASSERDVTPAEVKSNDDLIKEITNLVSQLSEIANDVKKAEPNRFDVSELVQRGSSVGIARRDGEPLAPQTGYAADFTKYADPANWQYACDTDSHIAKSIVDFNTGKSKGKYDPRSQHVLGRRIARLASEHFGKAFVYDPATKQVGRKETKMTEKLNKADKLGPVLADLRGALNSAVDALGSDPAAVGNLLTQALSALDVIADTESVDTGTEMPEAPTSGATVDTLKAMPSATTATTATTDSSSSSSTPSTISSDEIFKQLATLSQTVADLQAQLVKPAEKPVEKAETIADLNAQVASKEDSDPVIKALREGGPDALKKALTAAGSEQALYEKTNSAVIDSFKNGGFVTARKLRVIGN